MTSNSFKPELVHVKTVEQAEALDAPAYIVSAVPDFPPRSAEEKQARAVSEVLLCVLLLLLLFPFATC